MAAIWRKEFKTDLKEHANHLWVAIIAFLAIGTFFQQPAGFVVAGIFTAYFILNQLYNKYLGNKLTLHTPATKIKAFPDEEVKLTFQLENRSIIPIFSSRFEFQTAPVLREQKYLITTGKIWNLSRVPLTLMGKRKTFIEFSVVAKHRGTSRLDKIVLDLPHLFNFDTVFLKYAPAVRGEFLIFPRLLPVNGIETIVHPVPGQNRTNFSPFEDILSTRGTRDYQYSDPFHHINWKASAKTQQLQTNVYEKVTDMSFILVVNLGENLDRPKGNSVKIWRRSYPIRHISATI
ncbi:DUF58 domain-containing protein [Lentibacillus sediminis]|uniref:DUF58 domain-containing protein n=1 Tax=Lentibacillus sediminis TaxID=1940529 RepID=UPI000C1BB433|nr:DUF58 domain-containing protein [Lentibacillus sediminis]